jgi:tetratricopeptide (TPR) repeat protein
LGETAFTYRAFLSYCHADGRIGARVHPRLEAFHIDKDLIGQQTPIGPIPRFLRPIFRDRNDFVAGDSLNEQTLEALSRSAALILLASPHSAQSFYVNEEVRLFKSLYPERPVVPLILDGEPGGGARECFPPALRFKLDAQGALTQEPENNILAADLRETGDGFDLALAKVAARLIGLAPDDLYRRAERERRRLGRLRAKIAAVLAALVLTTGGLMLFTQWQGKQLTENQITFDEINALVERLLPVQTAQAGVPDQRKNLKEAITAIAQGAAVDPRKAEALRLLREGKAAEAEPLLLEAIQERAKRREREIKEDAADYRHLASIAAIHDPGKAREYYAKAVALDPANPDGLFQDGWFQLQAQHLDAAEKSYRALLRLEGKGADESQIFWARSGLGDIAVARGDLKGALAFYGDARSAMERLSSSDAGNADWQRDLSVSENKIGDVLVKQGNLVEALKSYRAGLAIRERLSSSDAGNADWQRDLSVSENNIGDVLVSQGNLVEALKSYRAGLAIAERLASSDAGNADWQRDLSVYYDNIGDVLVSQGNLVEALKSYRAGLAIRERLASSGAGNADWQRDLIVSCVKIAEAFPSEARVMLTRAGAIANRLRGDGRLAPADAWIPDMIAKKLAALHGYKKGKR